MKTHDVQRLHDTVKSLGDAALDIATALSAFLSDIVDAGEFKRPGDVEVLPVEQIAPVGVFLGKPNWDAPAKPPDPATAEGLQVWRWIRSRCEVLKQANGHATDHAKLWENFSEFNSDQLSVSEDDFRKEVKKDRYLEKLRLLPKRPWPNTGPPLTAERFHKLIEPSLIELWVSACCDGPSQAVYHDTSLRKDMPKGAVLYTSYAGWCGATGNPCATQRSFVIKFNKSGFRDRVRVHGRGPGHPGSERSFVSGKVLSGHSAERRHGARRSAISAGFDLEHWCAKVRSVRLEVFKIRREEMARLIGVGSDAVGEWERGTCFATAGHRKKIELIARSIGRVEPNSWKLPCD